MLSLKTPLSKLYGVGPTKQKALKKLGLKTIRDLIFYFPFRYNDFSKIVPIDKIEPGQTLTILGEIKRIKTIRTPRRRMILTRAEVSDKTGTLESVWFNQPYLRNTLKKGQNIYLSGRVDSGSPYHLMRSPEYEIYKPQTTHTARIIPVYNTTAGLTPKWLRYLVSSALPASKKINDYLPIAIRQKHHLLPLNQALEEIHFPTSLNRMKKARKRLAFDEFFLLQLAALQIKRKIQSEKAPLIPLNVKLAQRFTKSLPFKLTGDQRVTAWEILKDLAKDKPANRLLEGDVGSGKTVVATLAMLETADAGYQAVLMAPTEILAQQHFKKISELLKGFKTKAGLITRSKQINPQGQILIGTHALIQDKIKFPKLGLVVVDEQHRFGVRQRTQLKSKSGKLSPHFLSMTATPIPRSLALTLYGDLDISLIRQMPPGRKKIITRVVPPQKRAKAYEFIQQRIEKKEQVFVICPLIEESDKLGVAAATKEYEKLKTKVFPQYEIGLLHGRLKTNEKDRVMAAFKKNKIQILVSTAVVEVGIDIPNATIMMIEGTERFGLASLHQFRGRVGREKKQSYCFLFTDSKSSNTLRRLRALVSSENGFELAEYDLKSRGPGEIYGTKQSGYLDLKIGSLLDYALIKKARTEAEAIVKNLSQYPLLKRKIQTKLNKISLE